jgi:hypothetical protein
MPGISNYLVGKAELKDIIVPVKGRKSFCFAVDYVPPNPASVWIRLHNCSKQCAGTISYNNRYRSVGMVSDAMTLGKFADCTLYLVRQGHTYKADRVDR